MNDEFDQLDEFDKYRKIKFSEFEAKPQVDSGLIEPITKKMQGPRQQNGGIGPAFNETIPAGFTYLGQLITHDMISSESVNRKTPYLRLRTLYGGGPETELFYLKDKEDLPQWVIDKISGENGLLEFENELKEIENLDEFKKLSNSSKELEAKKRAALKIFKNVLIKLDDKGGNFYDIERIPRRERRHEPIMADTRNDRNFIISQLYCAFANFHNAVAVWLYTKFEEERKKIKKIVDGGQMEDLEIAITKIQALKLDPKRLKLNQLKGRELLELTEKYVTWHYQWIVVNQFLPMLVGEKNQDGKNLIQSLVESEDNFKLFDPTEEVRLMPEFSKAAFRIGHSQVRDIYVLPKPGFSVKKFQESDSKFLYLMINTKRVKLFLNQEESKSYDIENRKLDKIEKEYNEASALDESSHTIRKKIEKDLKSLNKNSNSTERNFTSGEDVEKSKQLSVQFEKHRKIYEKLKTDKFEEIKKAKLRLPEDLRGFIKRGDNFVTPKDSIVMDWSFFFDYRLDMSTEEKNNMSNSDRLSIGYSPQFSLAIDHQIAPPLYFLFFLDERQSLPMRDYNASHTSGQLPRGDALLGKLIKAGASDNPNGNVDDTYLENIFEKETNLTLAKLPLGLYILLEAEKSFGGKKLGTVGSRIVAEQIIWALKKDEGSYLSQYAGWQPVDEFKDWRKKQDENTYFSIAYDYSIEQPIDYWDKFGIVDLLEFHNYFKNQQKNTLNHV